MPPGVKLAALLLHRRSNNVGAVLRYYPHTISCDTGSLHTPQEYTCTEAKPNADSKTILAGRIGAGTSDVVGVIIAEPVGDLQAATKSQGRLDKTHSAG